MRETVQKRPSQCKQCKHHSIYQDALDFILTTNNYNHIYNHNTILTPKS